MNRMFIGIIVGILLTLGLGWATAQDAGTQDDEMAAAMASAQPSAMHKDMMLRAGDFVSESRMHMGPGMEPQVSKGESTFKAILGGRFLIEESKGEMMGMPMEGFRIWGFNNETGQMESVWTYTMGTGILSFAGTPGDDGWINGEATWNEGGGKQNVKVKVSSPDPDTILIKMMGPPELGDNVVVYEEKITRKK